MAANKNGIGYSPLSDKVYMGKQNKAKGMWVGEKTDITQEFIAVAHEYFEVNKVRSFTTVDGLTESLFFHINKDEKSIDKLIKHLTKLKTKL